MAKIHKVIIIAVLILFSCRNAYSEFCSTWNVCGAYEDCYLSSGSVFCFGCWSRCQDAICPPDCQYPSCIYDECETQEECDACFDQWDAYNGCLGVWDEEKAASDQVCVAQCTFPDFHSQCSACGTCGGGGDPDPGNNCNPEQIAICNEDPVDIYHYDECYCQDCQLRTFISCEDIEIDWNDKYEDWNNEIWNYDFRYKVYFKNLIRTDGSYIEDIGYYKRLDDYDGEYHYRGYLDTCDRDGIEVPCAYLFKGHYKLEDKYEDDCETTEPSGTFFFSVNEKEPGLCGKPDLDFTKWETAWTSLKERMPFSLLVFADHFFDMSSMNETPVTLSFPFFDDIELVFADIAWLRDLLFVITVISLISWLMRKIL
jgi:hypothetical protein